MMSLKRTKVLIAKPGLDGHEMGARLISRVLRDAGMEVVYTGPRQAPDAVVSAALQEDVDVVGLSYLTGAHKEHTGEIMRLMRKNGMDPSEIVFAVGGVIPPKDVGFLKSIGVDVVFGPGSDTRDIVKAIVQAVREKKGQATAI